MFDLTPKQLRPLSAVSYCTLKYIAKHKLTVAALPAFRYNIICSHLDRGYIDIDFTHDSIELLEAGAAILELYGSHSREVIFKKEASKITDRLAGLLRKKPGTVMRLIKRVA